MPDHAAHSGSRLPEDSDWSPILTQLMEHGRRKDRIGRKQLANNPQTVECLDIALGLLRQEFRAPPTPADGGQQGKHSVSALLAWLSYAKVEKEAKRAGKPHITSALMRDRWPYAEHFVQDLLSYALWPGHWQDQMEVADEANVVLTGEGDFIDSIHHLAHRELLAMSKGDLSAFLLVAAAISEHHPQAKDAGGKIYRSFHTQWKPVYEAFFAASGIELRDGISMQDIADILSALSDGLGMRMRADNEVAFIDQNTGHNLLGKAILMLLAGCVRTEASPRGLNDTIRALVNEPTLGDEPSSV